MASLNCVAAFVSVLPHGLALRVFSFAPADSRARSACVCTAWRAALADPAAWTRLDMTCSGGMHWSRSDSDAALTAAAARAAGRLQLLDVRGCGQLSDAALRAVLVTNGAALSELRISAWMLRADDESAVQGTGGELHLDVLRLALALRTLVVLPEAGAGDEEDREDAEPSPYDTSEPVGERGRSAAAH